MGNIIIQICKSWLPSSTYSLRIIINQNITPSLCITLHNQLIMSSLPIMLLLRLSRSTTPKLHQSKRIINPNPHIIPESSALLHRPSITKQELLLDKCTTTRSKQIYTVFN